MEDSRFELSSFGANLFGAATIIATIVLNPILLPRLRRWGATDAEVLRPLPGDDLVLRPKAWYTQAITIEAAPAEVWSWLVQIGQGRGGMYSYTGLENLVGSQLRNANQIIPEFQSLVVGNLVHLAPEPGPSYKVAAVEPSRLLLLSDADRSKGFYSSWAFVLEDLGQETTRLISRWRLDYVGLTGLAKRLANFLMWTVTFEPVACVMDREMLRGIAERAELGGTMVEQEPARV